MSNNHYQRTFNFVDLKELPPKPRTAKVFYHFSKNVLLY